MTSTTFEKSIRYDRETRDFAMYLDGEMVGYARTYHEAEVALDILVYDLLSEGQCATAQALDGGTPVEKPGAFCTRCAGMLDRIFFETLADPPADPDPGPEPWPSIFRPVVAPRLLDEADAVLTAPATAEHCPLKRRTHQLDLVVRPRHCANCDGEHSIQACPEILAALFAPQRPAKRLALVAALAILAFVLLACAGDATCSPRNDGSRAAATCVTQ